MTEGLLDMPLPDMPPAQALRRTATLAAINSFFMKWLLEESLGVCGIRRSASALGGASSQYAASAALDVGRQRQSGGASRLNEKRHPKVPLA
jgi:hypothetical protein